MNHDAEGNQESKEAGSKVDMAKTETKQNKNLLMVKVYQLHLHGVRGGINLEDSDTFCLLGEGLCCYTKYNYRLDRDNLRC